MKKTVILLLVVGFLSCKTERKRTVLGESDFQIEMNTKFKDASKSPLTGDSCFAKSEPKLLPLPTWSFSIRPEKVGMD